MALALACFSNNSGAWAAVCSHLHRISSLSTTRKGGGSCWCPTFFCRPASAPNTTPDSPCVFGSATLGTLGRKLTTLFRPDVTVRGSFCSRSPFICSSCVIFYFRPHPSRMQLVKLGVCGGSTDTVGRLQRHLSFSLLHIAHEWVHKLYIYLVDARSQLCVPLLCGRGTWGLDAAARG